MNEAEFKKGDRVVYHCPAYIMRSRVLKVARVDDDGLVWAGTLFERLLGICLPYVPDELEHV